LYGEYGMKFISWWTPGQETMSSSKPLAGPADLKDWKFRSPPGMETEIFASMGASPIVMDFGEVFTALETKIIDGADASNLANNKSMGIYDIVKHATYPGFHSMPADHIAINKEKWDELPPDLQRIIEVAGERMGFRNSLSADVTNHLAAQELQAAGVTLYDWSAEDRGAFRKVAQAKWQEWADRTPEARKIVDSHIEFMKMLGLIKD
ncbi:MAG: TRAP transporter substrate-binding protein DctP, partial [Candidatus Competibacteraceae bacterium]|nr:TRAP transporter substrate-binding protein DctP [Candidatus Competibacteraceae bacterium]